MTNREKLNEMSDMEFVDWYYDSFDKPWCQDRVCGYEALPGKVCAVCFVEWLQEEAE